VRDARLAPGLAPTPERRRRAAIAGAVTLAFLALCIYGGDKWWNVEATAYAADIYHPSDLHTALTGNTLDLSIGNFNVKQGRWKADSNDELLLDHGHIMHLYAIRQPAMDAAFHLHPVPMSDKHLGTALPTMPPGDYKLYADVVHLNGFPETLTATLTIPPGLPPTPLARDDASAFPSPLRSVMAPEPPSWNTPVHARVLQGDLGPAYKLPDGYTLVWDRPANIGANTAYTFHFRLLDPAGHPAADVQPYLGMAGHAAFVKTDGTTFAHTHPEGSAAMPAVLLANPADAATPGMTQPSRQPLSATVEFPYGFPSPGRYRIFIQMKHSGTVETGVFDAEVH
jgi:hypothetical protein